MHLNPWTYDISIKQVTFMNLEKKITTPQTENTLILIVAYF